jgi:hypothetical protein
MLRDLLIYISTTLEKLNNLPNITGVIGLALLTILIPLAIATLMDAYQKRREQSAEFANLDLHVILDQVFGIKRLLLYGTLIFVPMIFWEISCGFFRLFEIALSFLGICLMVKTLLNIYSWVKGTVFPHRFSYLRNLKKHTDLEAVWRSVWEAKSINLQNEKEFFQIFSSTIDELIGNHESKS